MIAGAFATFAEMSVSGGGTEGDPPPRRALSGLPDVPGNGENGDEIDLAHRATEEFRAAATLMADAQRVANFGSWEWRIADNDVSWSEQLFRIFGLDHEKFKATFQAYIEHVHPADRELVSETIERSLEQRHSYRFDHRVVRPDGMTRSVRCYGEPILDERTGEVLRLVGVCQDVTELAMTEQARVDADARFRSAFENAPIGIALVRFESGSDAILVQVNRSLVELMDRDESELVGAPLSELSLAEDAELDAFQRERLVAGDLDSYSVERRALLPGDRLVWLQMNVSLVNDAGTGHELGIVQVQDVTERKRFEEQLRHIADHDSLTSLLNRRRFREELDTQIALKRRYGGAGALMLLDVDGLKQINDTRGHGAGDAVLRRVGETLRLRVRSTDVVARLAGDEFAVMLPNSDPGEAENLGHSLIELLRAEEVAGITIAASIGITTFNADSGTPEDVLAAADAAMYSAKQGGGGTVGVAQTQQKGVARTDYPELAPRPSRTAVKPRTSSMADRVRTALRDDRLVVYRQPALDLRSHEVAHQELLVRMRDGGGVLAAADFLGAAAQQPGLCTEIDSWVLDRAIGMLTNGSRGTRVHVNLSGETLDSPAAVESLIAAVRSSAVDEASLGFEIGETAIARDVDRAEDTMGHLAETGCPLILDGFSASFGSFEYLQRLPLDQIKIDGSLVRAITAEDPDHATVRAVVRLAHGTDKTTVAKFVDSESVMPLLRMFGVDMAQGYLVGEPEPLTA